MSAVEQASAATIAERSTPSYQIPARIDRLPLTRVQWELAILVEITWGFIIVDTDGIGSRLYPFVWRPLGSISNNEYAVIQALQGRIEALDLEVKRLGHALTGQSSTSKIEATNGKSL